MKIEKWLMRGELPLTPREKKMVKWFVKFELSLFLIIICWITPAFATLKHYDNYQTLLKQVDNLQTREVSAKTTNEDKKNAVGDRAGDVATVSVKEQIRKIAEDNNFEWIDYLLRLAKCESTFNQYAVNENGGHSKDRGVFQINNKYHGEVSDECAFDIKCATEWTMWRIESGHQAEWVCDSLI